MASHSIVSPADQRVTFVELLFDLVFVFSVTQVVAFLDGGPGSLEVGRAVLVFWLVWKGWSQFTWALNIADTTHPRIELAVLSATVVAFFMAVELPGAFGDRRLAFAVDYALLRVIGLTVFARVAAATRDVSQSANVVSFALLSISGLVAVLGGAWAGGAAQYGMWGLAVILDVISSFLAARREGWTVHSEHFCERHGLFVIIAIGETLIVIASGLIGRPRTVDVLLAAVLAVCIALGLWWTYFARARDTVEHALSSCAGSTRSKLARDAFTLAHFPLLCGIIAYAAAVEEVLAQPEEALQVDTRLALAVCLVLFVGGMGMIVWRAAGAVPVPRAVVTAIGVVAVVGADGVAPQISLTIVLATVVLVGALERSAGLQP